MTMALTNAQRQRRYRERRTAQQPRLHYRRPQDRSSRPQLWQNAVRTLLDLQDEYQGWLDNLPDSLGESVRIPVNLSSDSGGTLPLPTRQASSRCWLEVVSLVLPRGGRLRYIRVIVSAPLAVNAVKNRWR